MKVKINAYILLELACVSAHLFHFPISEDGLNTSPVCFTVNVYSFVIALPYYFYTHS